MGFCRAGFVCMPWAVDLYSVQAKQLGRVIGIELRGVIYEYRQHEQQGHYQRFAFARLPDEVSLHQIAQKIEFIAAIRQGMAKLDRGESVTIEQVEKELPSWIM